MSTQNLIIIVFVSIIAFLSGYFINDNRSKNSHEIKIDTLFIEKPAEPIIVEKIKPKLIYSRDTIIQTQPFTAMIDTVIQRDTIRINYQFPENMLDLEIFPKPDSIEIRNIFITKEVEKKVEWWQMPAGILSGVVLGFLIGSKN